MNTLLEIGRIIFYLVAGAIACAILAAVLIGFCAFDACRSFVSNTPPRRETRPTTAAVRHSSFRHSSFSL